MKTKEEEEEERKLEMQSKIREKQILRLSSKYDFKTKYKGVEVEGIVSSRQESLEEDRLEAA
eukprot:CAMPEP_0170511322 /NCGR_PEP_ID=MMETSP0208-20121228/66244_1 /TAXON_ID=197538 /ORGANISM="Strombidium inclinatum, Strain S3" /LENGTH=61 /DNA_ID=CAMNT_0010794857 /DNA_START=1376 /DNA_END=1561 /DNA_ORIENTATION=-